MARNSKKQDQAQELGTELVTETTVPQDEVVQDVPQDEPVIETTPEVSQDEAPAETTEVPQDEPAPEVKAKPTMKVGQRARELIQEGIEDNKGILKTLQSEYPDGKTSIACVAWYRADLKKKAKALPDPDAGYKAWLKANEEEFRARYEEETTPVPEA